MKHVFGDGWGMRGPMRLVRCSCGLRGTGFLIVMAVCAVGLACSSFAGPAGEAPAHEVVLGDDADALAVYSRLALERNPDVRAAFNQWKAALERIPQVKGLPAPRFTYTYYVEEVETRVGPQRQKVGINQMFPWFGTLRLRGDAAAEAAEAARQNYEKAKLSLLYRVRDAYHEYWYVAQAVATTREHIRLLSDMEGVVQTRFKTGAAPHSAVIQAQVELGKLDDRLRTLELLRQPLTAKLNAALNRPATLPLPWPRTIPASAVSFTDEEVMAWFAEGNPDLRRLDHLVAKEEIGIGLAKKHAYPGLTLGVDYVDTDEALNPGVVDSGKDPVMAMVSVTLPIWFGTYRAARREAEFLKEAAEERRADAASRIAAELALTLYRFRDADRKIDLYRDTLVPKAEQSLNVAQQGFQAGKTSFMALIDAQRLLLDFQLAGRRAQADRGQRLAEIEMLTGKEVGIADETQAEAVEASD